MEDEMGRECGMCTGFWKGKPEGKELLGKYTRKWECNIKMDLTEI
jgi:hypothetical protein